ncbi:ATP-binding protein [Sphingomonas aurantiaca]|uniref:ATP-binding protein n=1 Tax=Sphingomonas aurantiaca TaxID=185949 RepID=UPI003352A91E
MKFDILGRISNMDLPDGKTAVLYSVYEAVSNSIHAINDRFGEDLASDRGLISVDISLNDHGEVNTIKVSDNGVGFNAHNINSFETSDSRYKYTRGGKGVGRFVWIKTFKDISVESHFESDGLMESIGFRFDPESDISIVDLKALPNTSGEPGTTITISGRRTPQGGKLNQATFMKDLALHFFPLFISGTLPNIDLTYNSETRSLSDFIADRVDPPVRATVDFDADGEPWSINIDHMFIDPSISTELRNSYLLTAHGRLVGNPISIDKRYALKELPNGKAYVAVISGHPLDQRVDQQRLAFRFNDPQKNALEAAVLAGIEQFLVDHILSVRVRQRKIVEGVIYEHPQLSSQIDDIDEYVNNLYPGMDDEQIGQNLFVLLYREEKDVRKRVAALADSGTLNDSQRAEAEQTLEELSEQERRRLAELVVKRHQVLQAANMLLKFENSESESYYYEKVVHDLICPMGKMYSSGDYDDHNLWIVDESLSGYQFFSSDKTIRSLVGAGGSTKEPDLVFFNPLGFRRPETNDPITIVEFKRPGDKVPSKNPVDQVLGYIEEFMDHQVKDLDGEVVADINRQTPFNCYIVCELTEETRKLLERSVAQTPMPDGQGYYGWSKPHNASIQVISFRKMLRDAMMRNRVFFDALSLSNPSAMAKKRAAKAREKKAAVKIQISAE